MIESQWTVHNLLAYLKDQPENAPISLSTDTGSYRGYYEHVYIAPGRSTVHDLYEEIVDRLWTLMYGYKGGEYVYDLDCLVFVADYGETGDMLMGFTEDRDPITEEESIPW